MPDLVESLRNIEENCCAVSTYFHIVVYFFNSMYLLYNCFGNQIDDRECLSIIMEIFASKSLSNSFDRIDSKLIGLYNSASTADLPGFWIICATFH